MNDQFYEKKKKLYAPLFNFADAFLNETEALLFKNMIFTIWECEHLTEQIENETKVKNL